MFELFQKNSICFLYPKIISETVLQDVRLLEDLIKESGHREEKIKTIKQIGDVADQIVHEAITALSRSRIAPIDHDIIYTLITQIDGLLDYVDEICERIVMFGIEGVSADAIVLTEILEKSVEGLTQGIVALRSSKSPQKIYDVCNEIKRLKVEAGRILRRANESFFTNTEDKIEIIKWKDICINLERAIDRCEDIANILEKVVIEYA